MILNEFKLGWQNAFEEKLQYLFKLFPNLAVKRIIRFHGMLRVELLALDSDAQYVVNCVTYKIERDSTHVCEECGEWGVRRGTELLPERICLCWKCYALMASALESPSNEIQQEE